MKNGIKLLNVSLMIILFLSLCSCAQKGNTSQGMVHKTVGIEDGFQCPIMETEQGYYYNHLVNAPYELHYVDKGTGKDVILCNKPECKHDGNEFCVGTNKKYLPFAFQLYDGDIYMAAICDGESTHDFKLIRIAVDGSSLSEIATIYSTNLVTNNHPATYLEKDSMLIHRGKALFQICLGGNDQLEDTVSNGAFLYDLNSGELTPLYEDAINTENAFLEEISARGDYFYFITMDGKKHILHKYALETKTDEHLELLMNFSGKYAVMDDGTIYYVRKMKRTLSVRHPDGKNEDLGTFSASFYGEVVESDLPEGYQADWFAPAVLESSSYLFGEAAYSNGELLFISPLSNGGDQFAKPVLSAKGKQMVKTQMIQSAPDYFEEFYVNEETGEIFRPYFRYRAHPGSLLFMQYNERGRNELNLTPLVSKDICNDFQHYLYTDYHVYLSKEKIYVEAVFRDMSKSTPLTSYYYTWMSLDEFMNGCDFPNPPIHFLRSSQN